VRFWLEFDLSMRWKITFRGKLRCPFVNVTRRHNWIFRCARFCFWKKYLLALKKWQTAISWLPVYTITNLRVSTQAKQVSSYCKTGFLPCMNQWLLSQLSPWCVSNQNCRDWLNIVWTTSSNATWCDHECLYNPTSQARTLEIIVVVSSFVKMIFMIIEII